MKWFKFYGQDYISDPKMLSLTASERSCWITLLCYSSVNDNGKITFLSEEQLMIQAGLDFSSEEWDSTKGILKKLENLKMIQNDNGQITITNWQKRQETNLTSYERVKKHREKKRNDNAKITLEENRIDKNRDIYRVENPSDSAFKSSAFNSDYLSKFKNPKKIYSAAGSLAAEINGWDSRLAFPMLLRLIKTKGEQFIRQTWSEVKQSSAKEPHKLFMYKIGRVKVETKEQDISAK